MLIVDQYERADSTELLIILNSDNDQIRKALSYNVGKFFIE